MTTKQTIKKFLEPFGRYKKYGIAVAIAWAVDGAWWFIYPWLYSNIVNLLTNSQNTGVFSQEAWKFGLTYGGFIVFLFTVDYFTRNSSMLFVQNTMKDIYKKYLSKFFIMDNNHSELIWTGKLIQITASGAWSWIDLLSNIAQDWIRVIIATVGAMIFISTIDIKYMWLSMIIVIVMIPILMFLVKKTKKYRKEQKDIRIARSRQSNKIFMTKFEILQNNKTQNELDEIEKLEDRNKEVRKKINNRQFWTYWTPWFVVDIVVTVFILTTTHMITNWDITIWAFVGIWTALNTIKNHIYNLVKQFELWPDARIDVEKLWDTFDTAPSIIWYDGRKQFVWAHWDMSIKNLSFSYQERDSKYKSNNQEIEDETNDKKNKMIFEDFNLDIKWWNKIALVWPSGWGKTTLVKLLSWYLSPVKWVIIIDSQELPNYNWTNKYVSLKSYYQHIWYLTQEPSVFDATVLENLLYGLSKDYNIGVKWEDVDQETKDKVEKSIRLAQCDRVYDLKDIYDTEVWERGVKLSWWQKQRLAIAKIMLKNPTVILLDEPTSALDSYNEEQVTIAMNNLFAGKTVIIVAHRLQTVKNADEIIYIENGKILERWTHQELIKSWWSYYKMVELQSGF